jgi:putative sterol carrier protein
MNLNFPSDVWIRAMMDELNKSEVYENVAKNWEGDFYFIIEPGGKLEHEVILYMDLWHGKCRDAFVVSDPEKITPAFRLSGPLENWIRVMTKQLDPMQAMMTGVLKLKGNMAMVMKNVRAAKELVECCTRIPTDFPI